MKAWGMFALAMGVLFFGTGSYWMATWLSKWDFLIAAGCLGLSVWAAWGSSFWHLPLMLYAFGSLVAVATWPQFEHDAVINVALRGNAFMGLAEFAVCVGLFGLVCRERDFCRGGGVALQAVWAIGVCGILALPHAGPRSPPNNGLWFGNPSMAASLLACLLPFLWGASRNWLWRAATWCLTLAVIYRTGTSIPWGILGIVTAAMFVSKWPFLVWAVPLPAIFMAALGEALVGSAFWDSNGRFEIYSMAWSWFATHTNLFFGEGFSTTQILLPLEQIATGHFHGDYFLWLHSDWLQLLIEGGTLGMACALLSAGRLLVLSWQRPVLFGSLAGFMAQGGFNYPLRMPIHGFCLVLIAAMAEWLTRSGKQPQEQEL